MNRESPAYREGFRRGVDFRYLAESGTVTDQTIKPPSRWRWPESWQWMEGFRAGFDAAPIVDVDRGAIRWRGATYQLDTPAKLRDLAELVTNYQRPVKLGKRRAADLKRELRKIGLQELADAIRGAGTMDQYRLDLTP